MYSILLILLSLITVYSAKKCDRCFCVDVPNFSSTICGNATLVSDSIYNVTVDSCEAGTHCNITDKDTWTEPFIQFYCVSNDELPNVHHENCTLNSHCASGNCTDKKCIGIEENSTCVSTNQCKSQTYCDATKKICVKQKKNESCLIDEECVNYQGCHNGTCLEYWNLPPLSPVIQERAEEFCSTGFAFKGVCLTLINNEKIPHQCSDTCHYTLLEYADNYNDPDKCVCGYNSLGNSYCQLNSDSNTFNLYKSATLGVLKSECQVAKKYSCSNEVSRNSFTNLAYFRNAWKGYLQESDKCLQIIFSSAFFLNTQMVLMFFTAFLLILI